MPSLSIRKLDEKTLKQLRLRAAQRGVSMEEEVRQIIRQAVNPPERLGDLAKQYFGREAGVDLDQRDRAIHEPIVFSD